MQKLKKYFLKYYRSLLFFTLLLIPFSGVEAGSIMEGVSTGCRQTGDCSLNDFVRILVTASKNFLGLSGSIALLFFIYGGFTFLISGGSSEKVAKGKQILIGSVIGLVIIFISFTVIGFVLQTLDVPGKDSWFTTPGTTGS